MSYKADMLDLESEIIDLVPATLVAMEYIEALFDNSRDPTLTGEMERFIISKASVEAANFLLCDLRLRALKLAQIFHGPDAEN